MYDTIVLGCLVNPSFATDVGDIWLAIDTVAPSASTTFGSNYGKTIPYTSDPYPSIRVLAKSRMVFAIGTPPPSRSFTRSPDSPGPSEFEGDLIVFPTPSNNYQFVLSHWPIPISGNTLGRRRRKGREYFRR
jgi:hypothetical protein